MPNRIVIFVLAATATVFGAIAISQATSSSPAKPPTHRIGRVTHHVSTALERHFAVLRRAHAAAATSIVPPSYEENLTAPGTEVSEYQLEPARTQVVTVGDTPLFVTPGANGICLGIPAPDGSGVATGCGSLAGAGTHGLLIVQRPSSGPVTYGLVPNGDSVTATLKNGSTSSVTVTSNTFIENNPSVQSVSVHAPNGSVIKSMTIVTGTGE